MYEAIHTTRTLSTLLCAIDTLRLDQSSSIIHIFISKSFDDSNLDALDTLHYCYYYDYSRNDSSYLLGALEAIHSSFQSIQILLALIAGR